MYCSYVHSLPSRPLVTMYFAQAALENKILNSAGINKLFQMEILLVEEEEWGNSRCYGNV